LILATQGSYATFDQGFGHLTIPQFLTLCDYNGETPPANNLV
jgi:hypothetical protein